MEESAKEMETDCFISAFLSLSSPQAFANDLMCAFTTTTTTTANV